MRYTHTEWYASKNLPTLLDARSIARALGGDVIGRDQVVAPGLGHSRNDRSLSVRLSATAPDGFVIHSHAGDDWQSCRDYVKERLGIDRDSWRDRAQEVRAEPVEKARTDDGEAKRARESAARYVASLAPLLGLPGEDYLRLTRGISTESIKETLATIDAIGWHSSVYFNEPDHPLHKQKLGAIIGIMTDPATGKPTGAISRTYIHEGRKVAKAKTLSSPKGVVRLSPDDEVRGAGVLFVCEGIETALAAMAAGVRPVWACGDAETLGSLPLLPDIDLVVVADNDMSNTGEKAAREVAQRWREAGRNVHIVAPPKAGDFNNISMVTPYFYGEAVSGDDWITALADRRGLVVLDPDAPNLELPKTRAEWPTREALADQGGDFISRMFSNNVIDLSEAKTRREVSARIEGLKRIEDDVWGRPDGRDGFARIAEIEARTAEYFGRALGDEGDEAEAPTKLEPASDGAGDEPKLDKPKPDDEPRQTIRPTPFIWRDPATIPPRQWIYGRHYVRKFVTATVAPGGIGKSSLSIAEALAIITGRPLLGVEPNESCRVWLWNGEDPQEELDRRIAAACVHYGIKPSEIEGRLFVDTGRQMKIIIAEQTRSGAKIARPVVDEVIAAIKDREIGLMSVDPFVASHRVTENDNGAIEMVAGTWAEIADATGCAIELVHHTRKLGGAQATSEDGRGASALLAKARSGRVLNLMTEDEAAKAGVENRRSYFHVTRDKPNMAPATDTADWYCLKSVDLSNGDNVGVATKWSWPDAMEDVTDRDLRRAQTEVSAGHWRESPQAKDWVGYAIAKALKVDASTKIGKAKAAMVLKRWAAQGHFVVVDEPDAQRHIRKFVKVGEWFIPSPSAVEDVSF